MFFNDFTCHDHRQSYKFCSFGAICLRTVFFSPNLKLARNKSETKERTVVDNDLSTGGVRVPDFRCCIINSHTVRSFPFFRSIWLRIQLRGEYIRKRIPLFFTSKLDILFSFFSHWRFLWTILTWIRLYADLFDIRCDVLMAEINTVIYSYTGGRRRWISTKKREQNYA